MAWKTERIKRLNYSSSMPLFIPLIFPNTEVWNDFMEGAIALFFALKSSNVGSRPRFNRTKVFWAIILNVNYKFMRFNIWQQLNNGFIHVICTGLRQKMYQMPTVSDLSCWSVRKQVVFRVPRWGVFKLWGIKSGLMWTDFWKLKVCDPLEVLRRFIVSN